MSLSVSDAGQTRLSDRGRPPDGWRSSQDSHVWASAWRDCIAVLSSESIVSTAAPAGTAAQADPADPANPAGAPSRAHGAETCVACQAPLDEDQRYCLECGERRFPMSSVLRSGPVANGGARTPSPPPAPPAHLVAVPAGQAGAGRPGRGGTTAVLAGVGVLLLAMGVGVLIGRSTSPKPSAAAPQVITVGQPGNGAGAEAGAGAGAATSARPGASPGGRSRRSSRPAGQAAGSSAHEPKGVGQSESHPAPPTVVQKLNKKKGKNYEQESKNLPNVISTG